MFKEIDKGQPALRIKQKQTEEDTFLPAAKNSMPVSRWFLRVFFVD